MNSKVVWKEKERKEFKIVENICFNKCRWKCSRSNNVNEKETGKKLRKSHLFTCKLGIRIRKCERMRRERK
jgi:hypothetical protein